MANTRETMGEAACLDALVADTLTSFEDDTVTQIGTYALYKQTNLVNIKVPNCKTIKSNGLGYCTALETLDLLGSSGSSSAARIFNTESLIGSTNITHLILRYSGDGIAYIDANSYDELFTRTKLGKDIGAIYVPTTKLASYRDSDIWRTFPIFSIDDYPVSSLETITDSWSQIATKCANGEYVTAYKVGDRKEITIDGTTYLMVLAAKDKDVLASDGTTTVPTTWLMSRVLYTTHSMNSVTNNTRSWAASEIRSWLASTVLPLLPQDVQSAIKEVRKYSGKYENSNVAKDDQTSDKLWIPSQRETYGDTIYETKGSRYDILNCTSSLNGLRKKFFNGYTQQWWMRSCGSTTQFRIVNTSGTYSNSSDSTLNGVCLGFCI